MWSLFKDDSGEENEIYHHQYLIHLETLPQVYVTPRLPNNLHFCFTEMQSTTNNAASKKRATLSELYRPPLELIFQGNFTEAKEAGSTLKKWLLVNVQDAREFSSHILNRDVWHNARVKTVVQSSFLLWQVSQLYHNYFIVL